MNTTRLSKLVGHKHMDQEYALAILDRNWPIECSLIEGPSESIFQFYPRLFLPIYPHASPLAVDQLSLSCRLIASSVVVADSLLDGEANASTLDLLRVQALQYEAQLGLFPIIKDEKFWVELRCLYSKYVSSIILQHRYQKHRNLLPNLLADDADYIAVGKTCLARTGLLGLSYISNKEPDKVHLEAIDSFNLARQLYDDLIDWRADLIAGRPSTIVAALVERNGILVINADWLITRKPAFDVYYNGIADDQCTRIMKLLEKSERPFLGTSAEGWFRVLASLRNACENLRLDMASIVGRMGGQL